MKYRDKLGRFVKGNKLGFQKGHPKYPPKDMEKFRKRISELKSGKNNPNYGLKRELSPSWKGGIIKHTEGYRRVYKPFHPFTDKQGYILEHRLVAEKQLNRYLTHKEIIHHINKIKNDNRPENLYLFFNLACHQAYHTLLRYGLVEPIVDSNLFPKIDS